MSIAVGDKIPDIQVMTTGPDGPVHVQTGEVLGSGKVVLFAGPGAFTPTCSDYHLPSYVIRHDELMAKGVDTVACISVNDPFVMAAWGESQNVGDAVELLADGQFTADVMGETLGRSNLGELRVGGRVNLERAAAINSRLGGHIVQGHVDGTGVVVSRAPSENWEVVRIEVPAAVARYIVEKGSITVDGISLTVSALGADPRDWFEVSLIPTTRELTTLGSAAVGTQVHLEVDVIAKYVERLLSGASGEGSV